MARWTGASCIFIEKIRGFNDYQGLYISRTFLHINEDTIFRGGFGIVYQIHALVAVKSANTKEELNHSNYPKESIRELLPTRPCRITGLTKVDHMYNK